MSIAIILTLGATAQSDFCATATPYTVPCSTVSGDNIGATTGADDSYSAADICALSVENTVWYTFTAPSTDLFSFCFTAGACAPFGSGLQTGVLSGPCGGPYTSLGCGFIGSLSGTTCYDISLTAGQQVYVVIDGDGGDECTFDMSICASVCAADVGTFTILENGAPTAAPLYMCPNTTNCIDLVSNNDFTLPPPEPGELAELMYALYTCPPTTGDPATDPCYSGLLWTGQDFNDCNPSLFGLTGTWYFVPITADDGDDGGDPNGVIHWDQNGDGCFDMGAPIEVVYLNATTAVVTENCDGTVDITISGGGPEFTGGNYTITNTGLGTLTGTPITHGGTVTITGLNTGDGWSIDVTDGEGCLQSFSGTFSLSAPDAGTNGAISLCTTDAATDLFNQLGGTPDNTGTWTGPSGLGGGFLGTFDPATDAGGVYTYTVTGAGCPNAVATVTVTLDVAPDAGTNGTLNICTTAGPTDLFNELGGTPDNGGTWTGPSALAGGDLGTFDPATDLAGTYTYTVTGTGTCADAIATVDVTITSAPDPGTNGAISLCTTDGSTDLINQLGGTPDAGGTWSGPSALTGGDQGTFDPATNAGGTYTYTVTVAGCGSAAADVVVTLDVAPDAGTNGTLNICATAGSTNLFNELGGTPDNGGSWTGPSVLAGGDLGTFDPATDLAGTYTYTVTGTGTCADAIATVDVTITTAPDAGTNGSISLCSNDAATDLINQLGGTPDAGGTWSGPSVLTGGDQGTFDPAINTSGTYTYTVTVAGCGSAAADVIVTVVATPDAGAPGALSVCLSGATTDLFNELGGTPDNGGTWTGPSPLGGGDLGTFDPATDLAGVYTYTVTGTAPCLDATADVTVSFFATPSYSVVITDENCGLGDGEIVLTGSGGGGSPYMYSIDGGTTFQASGTFTGLSAGGYTVVVEDANGCQITGIENVATTSGMSITSLTETGSILCNGDCTGELTVVATGGTTPYTYQWFDAIGTPIGPNSDVITGLCAGDYSVTITDASGSGGMFWSEDFDAVPCTSGCDPSIVSWNINTTVGANGATANTWYVSCAENGNAAGMCGSGCGADNSLHVGNVAGSTGSLLCPGGDCGAAYDASSPAEITNKRVESPVIDCSGQAGITLDFNYIEYGEPGVDGCELWYFDGTVWSMLDPLMETPCCGGPCTGLFTQGQWTAFSIPLPASADGNPNVQLGFFWTNDGNGSGWDPSFAVDDLQLSTAPGGGGCSVSQSITISEPAALSYTATITDASCAGNDGEIDITASGGTSPYQYSNDNGTTFQPGNVFTGLAANTYDIVVEDANGCQVTGTETVNGAAGGPGVLVQNFIAPLCNGSSNGSITVIGTGTAPLTYSLNGGPFGSSGVFTGLSAGSYTVEIMDGAGCITTVNITVTEPAVLDATDIVVDETCTGNDGSVDLTTTGGTTPYSWSWTGPGGFTATTEDITGLVGGTYDVVITDANGCTFNGSYTLTTGGGPTITAVNVVDATCTGVCDATVTVTAVGVSPITYDLIGVGSNTTGAFTGVCAGTYTLDVTDNNGCVTTQSVTVSDNGIVIADFTASPTTGFAPLDVTLTNNSSNATSYTWDFGTGDTSNAIDTNYIYTADGTYDIILYAYNGSCYDSLIITIVVIGDATLTIPNVFTPNGDGTNDVWIIAGIGIDELTGQVYNRWGELIYEWSGRNGWWDGRTMAGQEASEGTYYYIVTATGLDGTVFEESGHVTLTRTTNN